MFWNGLMVIAAPLSKVTKLSLDYSHEMGEFYTM